VYQVPSPIDVSRDVPARVAENRGVCDGRKDHAGEKARLCSPKPPRALGCEALFVGDGPCAREVVQVYPRARVTGWVSRGKVTEYLKTARVLVFPSLWYETEGLSVIEAAALGVPGDCVRHVGRAHVHCERGDGVVFCRRR
jgi:hypothetical protein